MEIKIPVSTIVVTTVNNTEIIPFDYIKLHFINLIISIEKYNVNDLVLIVLTLKKMDFSVIM